MSGEGETGQRNETAYGHENHGVGVHFGVAHGGDMAPLRGLPSASGLGGLCGRRHGGPSFILHQIRNEDSL